MHGHARGPFLLGLGTSAGVVPPTSARPPMPLTGFAAAVCLPQSRRQLARANRSRSPPAPHRPRRPIRALLDPAVACVLSHTEAAALLRLRAGTRAAAGDRRAGAGADADGAAEPWTALDSRTAAPGPWSVNLGRDALPSVVQCDGGLLLVVPARKENDDDRRHEEPRTTCRPQVTFAELAKMAKKGRIGAYECFYDGETAPQRIAAMSATTQRTASLQPVVDGKPPTVVLGGFGMHRFKGTDPAADTRSKIAALGADYTVGRVLDVCTGLGYTAIALAGVDAVSSVTTIELDPVMVEMQRRNPWSEQLFRDPRIHRLVENAVEVLPRLPADAFHAVVHDPPAQALAGELYAESFYAELARVMAPGGKLFHYIGDPASVESGRLYKGIFQRLSIAGFINVRVSQDAFGLTAHAS